MNHIHMLIITELGLNFISPVMSRKDLMEKYGDEIAVMDLIARKTADNMYESDLNFPDREDPVQLYQWSVVCTCVISLNHVDMSSHILTIMCVRTCAHIGAGITTKRLTRIPEAILLAPVRLVILTPALQVD